LKLYRIINKNMEKINFDLNNPNYDVFYEGTSICEGLKKDYDVIINYFNKEITIPVRNYSVRGKEIFYPEENEIWLFIGNHFIQNTRDPNPNENWDTNGLSKITFNFPNELGEIVKKPAYVYELERGDYDIVDIIEIMSENMKIV